MVSKQYYNCSNHQYFDVYQEGNYTVVIKQTSGCVSQKTLLWNQISVCRSQCSFIPNYISPNNDGVNDTWILPQEYVSGSNTEIVIKFKRRSCFTNNYQNNWPENELDFKSVNPIYYYNYNNRQSKRFYHRSQVVWKVGFNFVFFLFTTGTLLSRRGVASFDIPVRNSMRFNKFY
jgi:hypothetical protein